MNLWLYFIVVCTILLPVLASPPLYPNPNQDPDETEENDVYEGPFKPEVKRGCVGRGGNCDHRPEDCCYSSSCRCNLWGANCRCRSKMFGSRE